MFCAYSVYQDGNSFYLKDGSALMAVITYPKKVMDFDLKAGEARQWFERTMKMWGIGYSFN